MLRWAVAALLLGGSTAVAAGPFGLDKGTPLRDLKVIEKSGATTYLVGVPQPHGEFDTYLAYVTPEHGLCKITAAGKLNQNDRYGQRTRQVFADLKGALSAKYGPSKDYDFLHAGALWKEPGDWTMSVRQKERSLASFWSAKNGSRLGDGIGAIVLDVGAVSSTTSYVSLSYEFDNFAACRAGVSARENSVL